MIERGIVCRCRTVHDLGVVGDLDEAMIVLPHEDGASLRVLRVERTAVLRLHTVMGDDVRLRGARALAM